MSTAPRRADASGAITVREVVPTDAAAWASLRAGLWPDTGGGHADEIDAFFAGTTSEPTAVLVAVAPDGDIAGMVELSLRAYADGCETSPVAYLEGWYVAPRWRRRSVGAALVAAAEEWGRSRGCREIASDTEVHNDVSTSAHLALGFEDVGTIRCFRKSLEC